MKELKPLCTAGWKAKWCRHFGKHFDSFFLFFFFSFSGCTCGIWKFQG